MRLLFQDEARFGRMSNPRRCWAPRPLRPLVKRALVREYLYAYAAVSPNDGALDWCLAPKMNTDHMGQFLTQVQAAHPEEFVVMVLDGASSHRAKDLATPENMTLIFLPPYSPELNPAERLWEEIREKEFGNRIFDFLHEAVAQARVGLERLSANSRATQSLTGWPWILQSS